MIAVLGPLTWDVVDDAPPRPGGAVFYAARALAAAGAQARLGAACARRDRPAFAARLAPFGLPVTWRDSAETCRFRLRYAPDGRREVRLEAVADPWTPEGALAAAGDAAWVHVGGLVRGDFPPETLAALAAGRRLLVDGQGLVRLPRLGPLRVDGDVGDALRHAAVLKVDEEEAALLAGRPEPAALRALGVPEALLTLGPRGAWVVTAAGEEHVPAVPLPGPVDPTGAGDMFAAAYLAERARGAEPAAAARAAAAAVGRLLPAATG